MVYENAYLGSPHNKKFQIFNSFDKMYKKSSDIFTSLFSILENTSKDYFDITNNMLIYSKKESGSIQDIFGNWMMYGKEYKEKLYTLSRKKDNLFEKGDIKHWGVESKPLNISYKD